MRTKIHFSAALFFSLFVILFSGCKDDESDYVALSDNIQLELNLNSTSVELDWTLAKMSGFQSYRICRSLNIEDYDYYNGYYVTNPSYVIYTSTDFFNNSFVDTNPNIFGESYYWIEAICIGETDYGYVSNIIVKSELKSISVSGITSFNNFPTSVIFDKEENLLGLTYSNYFIMYNYQTDKIIGQIDFYQSYSQKPSFGRYNNELELYLSDDDGVISIYNAKTMMLKKVIDVPNVSYPFYSITTDNNEMLYASSIYGYYIYQINRQSGVQTAYSCYDDVFLQYDANSNSLIGLERESYPDIYKFQLNASKLISSYTSSYQSGYYYPAFRINSATNLLYMLPTVKTYNTSSFTLVSTTLGSVQDIDFSNGKTYMAPFQSKSITEISTDLSQRSIALMGYPVYLFNDNDKLITVIVETSTTANNATNNTVYKGYNSYTPIGIQVVDL